MAIAQAIRGLAAESESRTEKDTHQVGWRHWLRIMLVASGVGVLLLCATPGPHVRFSVAAGGGLILIFAWLGASAVLSGLRRQKASKKLAFTYIPGLLYAVIALHGLMSFVGCGEAKTGIILAFGGLFMFVASVLPLYAMPEGRREFAAILAVGLGLCFYAVVNILAYKLLGLSGLTMGSIDSVMVEVYGQSSDRMIAPFADGLNNFGNLAACGSALTGLGAVRCIRRSDKTGALILGVASVIGAYAVLLVQMRSAVIVIGMAMLFLCLGTGRWRRGFLLAVFIAFAFGPWVYVAAFDAGLPERFVGAYPMFLMRSGEDPFLLSGRVFVWDYAFQILQSSGAWFDGLGLAYRDMSPALKGIGMTVGDSALTCHNGPLDLIVSYGGLVGGAAIGGCGYLVWRLVNITNRSAWIEDNVWMSCGAIVVLMAASLLESLTNSGFFWGLMTITASAASFREKD